MDPQEPRSKAPSLLSGDAPPAQASKSPERILSGLQGSSASVPKPASSRRWIWPVALVGVAVAAIVLLDVGGVFEPSKAVPPPALASTPSEPAATPAEQPAVATPVANTNAVPAAAASAAATSSKPSTGSQNAAVILADQFGPASSSSTAAATAAPASSTPSKDTAALGDMFAPHAADKKTPLIPAARVAKRSDGSTNADSDVDLLAVLIKHLEVNDATGKKHARHAKKATADEEVLPQDCPPANTEAGVACRQRFCAAHTGQEDASCPAASPGGA